MDRGFARIAGVDEVGRGPLAGPVTACAVVLDMSRIPEGLNDSKKLSAQAAGKFGGGDFGLCRGERGECERGRN